MDTIGTIYTPYRTKQDCPIQPRYASGVSGRVELLAQYAEGLKDIETFSHIYLLYLFDRSGEIILARPTFLDETPHGIYASRHPCRPNSIGLSIVRLISREGATLMVEGVDMLNETPLLDIKPYISQYDAIPDANPGWTAQVPWRQKPEGRE
ncbi:tRNA (N6-threonylcarbamoyladenosine(37)-N6)-methyltransferase TrmO [Trichlorobacter lovleyi]|uniref:tRNA (N6-threonylcarbamoyladenosine(37)-N6)-methyltransferase TrmO n=1 Tax=Trichlorobacter lovleyi TaxID=313985 RepID=UPI0024812CCA|nr:tRNA (N6-threonylcarbamoyladenosine(37)-N6)-methyltransferase TrmO [Trichlorobacter lovleyi]